MLPLAEMSSSAACSETPMRKSTVLRSFWLIRNSVAAWTFGFAQNAIPKPAALSMGMSFDPSPTAMVCLISQPSTLAIVASNARFRSGVSTGPVVLDVINPVP